MVTKITISKHSVIAKKWLKPFYIHRYSSLKYLRSTNSGEPAAVVGFRNQIKVDAFLLPKSAAAGLLFFNLQLEQRVILRVGTNLVFVRIIFKNNTDIVALSIQIADLQGWQCVKIGEPAAGFGFMVQVNGGVLLLPKSAAAGLLFYRSLVIGQWSMVSGRVK
jgi:hypothetical protein